MTDEGKAFPEILLPEPQDSVCVLVSDSVKDSNMSYQSDKMLPFINWQGTQTVWDAKGLCGELQQDPWHGSAIQPQAGHFWLWNHEEGGWEAAHDWGKADTGVCLSLSEPERVSSAAVKRDKEVAVWIRGRSKGLSNVGKQTQQQESWWDGGYEGAKQGWEEAGKKGKL